MKHHRPAFRRVFPCVLVLAALAPLPAAAWDPEVHEAIARAAMGISAAAEARVPLEHRDAIFRELAAPDFVDKECRYHCADTGAKDPALVAEQILPQLVAPKVPMKPYQRAQLVGRYLHYVMDAVAPVALRRENAPKLLNFFPNRDFIFFRERRPAGASLSATLRARAQEMAFANVNQEEGYTAGFRCVVNATVDALLLLPPRADAVAAQDEGPVWFLVNRQDTGLAGKATAGEWTRTAEEHNWTYRSAYGYYIASGTWTTWNWTYTPGSKGGGDSFRKLQVMERRGAQLVELAVRQETGKVLLRGLFFNNNDTCAEKVALKAGAWTWEVPGVMPPHSLYRFDVEGPADLLSRSLTNGYKATNCTEAPKVAFVAAQKRVVVGNGTGTPRFEYSAQPLDITSGPKRSTNNLTPN